ncbi:MAG TPA: chorismate-binding protein, partial [Gemmatales bacterium]|nr:chorismate-binding protein [Gemmatales bacterium]
MPYFPDFATFADLARSHTMVPVYRQLLGDTLTPVTAFTQIDEGHWSFLFESVVGGEKIGRYSFAGTEPFLTVEAWNKKLRITEAGRITFEGDVADPLHSLEELAEKYRAPRVPGLPRFTGGAVGFAGYDTVRYAEHLPNCPKDDRQLPDLAFGFYDRMIIFDHINKTLAVVAHARIQGGVDLQKLYAETCQRVDAVVEQLQRPLARMPLTDVVAQGQVQKHWKSNFPAGGYQAAVTRCQEYIKAGDAFQVVLSQRLAAPTTALPFNIYRTLRVVNPSPFMFFVRTSDVTLIGSSPEILVRVEDDVLTLRPLAGTRRRGKTEDEDRRLGEELLADPKERAEHVMLVDLGRNDVGRVAQFGSVTLPELLTVERYSHVMHISSTVQGKLASDQTALAALRAALPAGTLSGAPKVRAMEIIDELESCKRGPYGGAVGYLDFRGNLDTCIALRTI